MEPVSLSLLVLKTRRMPELRAFYASLGLEFREERHRQGPLHYAGQVGDLVFEIYPLPDENASTDVSTRIGFLVEDLMQVVDLLRTQGTRITVEPRSTPWGSRGVVLDPDGRTVELYQR